MKLKNLWFICILTIFFTVALLMCSGGAYYTTGETVPFEYPVPDGMIEDGAEKEAMINAKIENLQATNKIFWGALPEDRDKLLILFQDVWSDIRSSFPGFEGLDIDWDEFGEENYEKIEFVEDYGYFASIMTYMAFVLREGHSIVLTNRMQGTNTFHKDVPMLNTNTISRIGACYTVTQEEELVVTNLVGSSNPYNLSRGDEIVGFNGVHWSEWVDALVEANIPVYGSPASSDAAIKYNLLRAGMTNVNLFEKINIKRANTGEIETMDVVYIPFKSTEYQPCREYIGDVPGVKTPEFSRYIDQNDIMTSGIIKDTNIGYIYVTACPPGFDEFETSQLWDPYETEFSKRFSAVISKMMDTDGLIIDLRYNVGGRNEVFYRGLSKLIDEDEERQVFTMVRRNNEVTDITALETVDRVTKRPMKPDNEKYDNPIVILTGPDCISACDFLVAFFDKFPEFTIIGMDNNGSFTGVSPREYVLGDYDSVFEYIPLQAGAYVEDISTDEEGKESFELLLRRSDFLDERIWHTKGSVMTGEDIVRDRAIEIIQNAE